MTPEEAAAGPLYHMRRKRQRMAANGHQLLDGGQQQLLDGGQQQLQGGAQQQLQDGGQQQLHENDQLAQALEWLMEQHVSNKFFVHH